MGFSGKTLVSVIVSLLFLTSCSGGDSSEVSKNIETSTNQNLDNSETWSIVLVPVSDDYDSASPVCDEPYGKFRTCEFRLEVTNVSKLPQMLEGIYFLETSDGTVYQEEKRWAESFTRVLNPGDTAVQWANFALPFEGELISRMYRAWGATEEPVFSHTFDPMWEMKYS
jgi:hypothetical protein